MRAKARHPMDPANWHWPSGPWISVQLWAAQAKLAGSQIRRTELGDRHARVNGSDKSPGSTESAIGRNAVPVVRSRSVHGAGFAARRYGVAGLIVPAGPDRARAGHRVPHRIRWD